MLRDAEFECPGCGAEATVTIETHFARRPSGVFVNLAHYTGQELVSRYRLGLVLEPDFLAEAVRRLDVG